jgi:hypothetical protein
MQSLVWLDRFEGGTLENGMVRVNELAWDITVVHEESQWLVRGGEKLLLITDSAEAVQAFLYGMALSYAVIPENIMDILRREFEV